MSAIGATRALVWREWVRLLRQPVRIVATVGTPLVMLAALGAGFAGSISGLMGVDDGRAYAAFLLPGMISMAALFAAVFGSISLIEDRDTGLLRVLLAGPSPSGSIVGAKLIGVGLPAFIQALVLLPACWILGVTPSVTGLLLAVLAVGMLTLGVTGLSLSLAWRVKGTQEFHALMNMVLMPMWLLSGAFYPASEAATPIRWLTMVNPLAWPTDAARSALGGEPSALFGVWVWPLSIAFCLGGIVLSVNTIRQGKRRKV
ncbi:MAG: ABC transporter permease [Phycisphaerales bacterium]